MVGSQLTFLSYGTTARSARFFGAGDRVAAVGEGVQATWLALGLGVVIVAVVELAAVPLVSVIAAGGDIAAAALPWVRIAILGAPAILVSLAGNGWMRGVQDTVRPLRYVLIGFGAVGGAVPAAGVRLARAAALGAGRLRGGQSRRAVVGRCAVLPGAAGRAGAAAPEDRRCCARRW